MTRVCRAAAIIQEGSLYVLLFLLPFSNAAIEVSFGILLLSWVVERSGLRWRQETLWAQPPLRPLLCAIGGYLVVCALSIIPSHYPTIGLRALFSKWMEYLGLFVIGADIVARRPVVLRRAMHVVVGAVALVLVEAVGQELWGYGPIRRFPLVTFERMTGPYKDPIDLATYLMVAIPLLLAYVKTRRRLARWVSGGVLLLALACLARTEAFGAWLGLFVGMVVLGVSSPEVRVPTIMVVGALLLGGGGYLQTVGRLDELLSLTEIGKVDRWMMWQAAIGMIRDQPLLGHGLNTFMANYLDYWVGGERMPRYAHNCYLQVAAETGLIGLALFGLLLGLCFTRLAVGLRRLVGGERILLMGLVGGLLAFVVQSGYDTNFYVLRQAVLFWLLAGLALGAACGGGDRPSLTLRTGTVHGV